MEFMQKYDLTPVLSQYLDRHLVFPLLEFLSVKKFYNNNDMMRGILELLRNTNMVDFVIDIHEQLYPDQPVPVSLQERRQQVVTKFKTLSVEASAITGIFDEQEVQHQIHTSRDGRQLSEFLSREYGFTPNMLDTIYKYAKFQYECGNYSSAVEHLSFVQVLVAFVVSLVLLRMLKLSPSDPNYTNACWGKLASEILLRNWDTAFEDFNKVRELIEANCGDPLVNLQQRSWLIHWSLFIFFNHAKGRDLILDMFLGDDLYLNAIQTMCPHVLRYLATAAIINKSRRQKVIGELVKVIRQESYTYQDPVTDFIMCLFVKFDFDTAQQKLRECDAVLAYDFFLVNCREDFIGNARLLIFETYCRIHECVSISMLAEKLNMDCDEAERWIVNLIRNAHLDAKIDSKLGHVVMGTKSLSPYQQVIDKTRHLAYRAHVMALTVQKKLGGSKPLEWGQWQE